MRRFGGAGVAALCLFSAVLGAAIGYTEDRATAAPSTDFVAVARACLLEGDAEAALKCLRDRVDSSTDVSRGPEATILEAYALHALGRPAAAEQILAGLNRTLLPAMQRVDASELASLLHRRMKRHERPDFTAVTRPAALAIDGDLSDWAAVVALPTASGWIGRAMMPNDSRLEGRRWGADELEDGSGALLSRCASFVRAYIAWDSRSLVLAFSVEDTTPVFADPSTGDVRDHIQIFIDAADRKSIYYRRGILNFRIEPRQTARLAALNRAAGVPPLAPVSDVPGAIVGFRRQDYGYTIEIEIPRTALQAFHPEENPWLGFNYLVVDYDDRGRLARRAAWKGVPGTPTGVIYEIEKWGTLALVGRSTTVDTMSLP